MVDGLTCTSKKGVRLPKKSKVHHGDILPVVVAAHRFQMNRSALSSFQWKRNWLVEEKAVATERQTQRTCCSPVGNK